MRRGEVWTVSGPGYAGKPRPAVIVQADQFEATRSITICAFTKGDLGTPLLRLPIAPSETNGLHVPSCLMIDKITTVPRSDLGRRIGHLERDTMARVEQAIMVFLGLG